jgi:hypothetical protein
MTSEQFVKQHYPKAIIEGYTSGKIRGMQQRYFLVWSSYSREEKIRLSEGDTKSKAWVNAKKHIESLLADKPATKAK